MLFVVCDKCFLGPLSPEHPVDEVMIDRFDKLHLLKVLTGMRNESMEILGVWILDHLPASVQILTPVEIAILVNQIRLLVKQNFRHLNSVFF